MRKGSANTARGARRFIDELIARVRRAGATGEIVVRVDSGFWSNDTIDTLGRLDVRYTMAVRTNTKGVAAAIAAIDEGDWRTSTTRPTAKPKSPSATYHGRRLIVRRTRLTDRRQLKLWPHWRHFGFLTDLDGDAVSVDAFHRAHAVVELDIRDLKEGAGLEHVPSGNFHANSAWLQCAVLAHNLIRWTATVGQATPWTGAPSPAPSASGSSPSPAGSSTTPDHHPARPAQLAMASLVHPGGWPNCVPCSPSPDKRHPAAGAPQTNPRADIQTEHDRCNQRVRRATTNPSTDSHQNARPPEPQPIASPAANRWIKA